MSDTLSGRRVMLVEDESLVAMLLETILEDMGCALVGTASSLDEGLALAREAGEIDAALLDVNVAGRPVFPIAEALRDRGVPFVFSTGYGQGGLPDEWREQPTIQKPFTESTVREALMNAMDVRRA